MLSDLSPLQHLVHGHGVPTIANNTVPDGSVRVGGEGLRTLSNELREHSEMKNPLDGILDSWFGRLKSIIFSCLALSAWSVFSICFEWLFLYSLYQITLFISW